MSSYCALFSASSTAFLNISNSFSSYVKSFFTIIHYNIHIKNYFPCTIIFSESAFISCHLITPRCIRTFGRAKAARKCFCKKTAASFLYLNTFFGRRVSFPPSSLIFWLFWLLKVDFARDFACFEFELLASVEESFFRCCIPRT